jgi:hypothetical protein
VIVVFIIEHAYTVLIKVHASVLDSYVLFLALLSCRSSSSCWCCSFCRGEHTAALGKELSGVEAVSSDLFYLYVNKGGLITIADDVVVGEGEVGGVDAVFEQCFEAILFWWVWCNGNRRGRERDELSI